MVILPLPAFDLLKEEEENEVDARAVAAVKDEVKLNMLRVFMCVNLYVYVCMYCVDTVRRVHKSDV